MHLLAAGPWTVLAALLFLGCAGGGGPAPQTPAVSPQAPTRAEEVRLTLLHFNDIYEITPLAGGRSGGPSRVATVRERLLSENPNTLTMLGGDLVSPSAMGTAQVDGERLAGRQMVAVLNALGLDYATLGNHEFDLDRDGLVQRLGEAEFGWVCGNVTWADGSPLPHVEPWTIVSVGKEGSATLRLGIVGAVLAEGAPGYVRIADPVATLAAQAREIRGDVDVLVALTHLALEQDIRLAAEVPEIDLILGGHEHENWELRRGPDLTPILKADANVRTVYVVRLGWKPETGDLSIEPELVPITDAIPEDPQTAAVVEHWVETAFAGFREAGFEPEETVATVPVALDGREAAVRSGPTALTSLIAEGMLHAGRMLDGDVDAAFYNAGSIRIDDVIPPGPVSQYDVIRILPFGGEIVVVEIAGGLLRRILEQGEANRGTGGFLQGAGIGRAPDGSWSVAGARLSDAQTYHVALNDFLLSGRETGLDFLMPGHPDLQILSTPEEQPDIRRVVIDALHRRYGT